MQKQEKLVPRNDSAEIRPKRKEKYQALFFLPSGLKGSPYSKQERHAACDATRTWGSPVWRGGGPRHSTLHRRMTPRDPFLYSHAPSFSHISPHSHHNTPERRAVPQVLDQVLDRREVLRQEFLLLIRRPGHAVVIGTPPPGGGRSGGERPGELARAALQEARGGGPGGGGARDARGLGHEVEVEELDELELDVARGRAAAEQRGDCEQAVLGLEGAGVARGVDECDDEG